MKKLLALLLTALLLLAAAGCTLDGLLSDLEKVPISVNESDMKMLIGEIEKLLSCETATVSQE